MSKIKGVLWIPRDYKNSNFFNFLKNLDVIIITSNTVSCPELWLGKLILKGEEKIRKEVVKWFSYQ